ncbi:hypothetical protein WR164_13960 [Philodulcilactobacillus myokoensis]|uniref:CopG family transcriptional regulator n=1 Tax=Philodulcilactobacillus myokoensis TaxID=2929573 RepID=A0A9W6B1W1_9LACO|nr:hypothetical protein [Philodulcilactobacillus myokoensis]GLB47417.1 hypothetical protein WR164_13960 [Philodulcilactobacillus myokoensis]
MANKNRQSILSKNNNYSKDLDTLFKSETVKKQPKSKANQKPKETRLTRFSKIKDFYLKSNSKKQFSIYLPEELQKQMKAKSVADGMSISDVIKRLILDHYLTDAEIKDAYNRGYDKRNQK